MVKHQLKLVRKTLAGAFCILLPTHSTTAEDPHCPVSIRPQCESEHLRVMKMWQQYLPFPGETLLPQNFMKNPIDDIYSFSLKAFMQNIL